MRLDALGGEHADEDGSLRARWNCDGVPGDLTVEIVGGRFAFEAPRVVELLVPELTLGGVPLVLDSPRVSVPPDRFVELRAQGMEAVRLHVLGAASEGEPGLELSGVELRSGGVSRNTPLWQHPGRLVGAPLVTGDSPVLVPPEPGDVDPHRCYWVRATGHAWAEVEFDHSLGGERSVTLQLAGALTVQLIGLEPWLQPLVRLWPPSASQWDGCSTAQCAPDADGRVELADLVPGEYDVSVERGWAQDRRSFGRARVNVLAGQRTTIALDVHLPARPTQVELGGTLLLPLGWTSAHLRLDWRAEGPTTIWASETNEEIPAELGEPEHSDAGKRFPWRVALPAPGRYELWIYPMKEHRVFDVPAEGLSGVELVVPAPAEVRVRFVDATSGAPIDVERLQWGPRPDERLIGTYLFTELRDPLLGLVAFQAPAGTVRIWPLSYSLVLTDENELHELHPGPNAIDVRVWLQASVHLRFLDGEAQVPWSFAWGVGARRLDGAAPQDVEDVARSDGRLWFREAGTYRLFTRRPIPGFRELPETLFDVSLAPDAPEQTIDVRLTRE